MRLAHEQSGTDIRVILASGSRFFLRGLCGILEDAGGINVVAQASSYKEVEKYLIRTEADLLFIDNQTFKLNVSISRILRLVSKITPFPKVICLDNTSAEESVFPNIIYLAKETGSSELIAIMRGKGLSGFVTTRGAGTSSAVECRFIREKKKKQG